MLPMSSPALSSKEMEENNINGMVLIKYHWNEVNWDITTCYYRATSWISNSDNFNILK